MPKRSNLGDFELMVMLALMRLGDDAYGVPISREIELQSGREVALGSVYATLERLEGRGLGIVASGEADRRAGRQSQAIFPRNVKRAAQSAGDTARAHEVVAWAA